MNNPNPLHPQGAFPENRGRSHVRIAVFTILAIHVVLLGALLLQGCKRTTNEPAEPEDVAGGLPPFAPTTNVMPPPPDIVTFTPPPEMARIDPPVTPPPVTPPVTEFAPPPPVKEFTPPLPAEVIPPVPPAAADREHVVVKGDSFYTLGKKYGVSTKAITDANPGVDARRLKIGQKLVIPPAVEPPKPNALDSASETTGKTYTVKSGDTLTRIAREHKTTIKALRRENNLQTDRLLVGQKLKIPENGANGNP